MQLSKTALVTGSTGFLGSFLTLFLLRQGYHVVALVRGANARVRLLEVLQDISAGEGWEPTFAEQLLVLEGDIRQPGFGLDDETQKRLVSAVGEIWHCAASFKFQERCREDVIAHNITGTRQVLDFARHCNVQRIAPVFYVSTAYAAPQSGGVVREELATPATPFRNLYEWSKQEAERLVAQLRREYNLPALIFRPSIVIGHSRTGRAIRFTGYYDVIRAIYLLTHSLEVNLGNNFDRNLRLRIRAGQEVRLNVVPVDFVIEAMWQIARTKPQESFIFNLTTNTPPLLADLFQQACEPLGVTGIELVEAAVFHHKPMTGLERIFDRKTQFQAPYLLDGPAFDNANFRRLVPDHLLLCPQADAALIRRVNEYYYREVLDRQFDIQRYQAYSSNSSIVPLPHPALRIPQSPAGW
jgi:nucleoside-diphosphate-sugar epimerase